MKKVLIYMTIFLLVVIGGILIAKNLPASSGGGSGGTGPMGPQGEQGPPGMISQFELVGTYSLSQRNNYYTLYDDSNEYSYYYFQIERLGPVLRVNEGTSSKPNWVTTQENFLSTRFFFMLNDTYTEVPTNRGSGQDIYAATILKIRSVDSVISYQYYPNTSSTSGSPSYTFGGALGLPTYKFTVWGVK